MILPRRPILLFLALSVPLTMASLYFSERELNHVQNKEQVQTAETFLYPVDAFSLALPKQWQGVEVYHDFGGFGYDEVSLCKVCGRVVSFGFSSGPYDYAPLFKVMYFPITSKGAPEIPLEYELVGENACTVYYAAAGETELSTEYAEFLTDLPEIFESFEAVEDFCL